ncbi:hypothetical protein ACOMHN_056426 [Nucella lapillus]
MVSAWYMDTSDTSKDQRDDHKYSPNKEVTLEKLREETGVLYFHVPHDQSDKADKSTIMGKLCDNRGYTYEDVVDIQPTKLPNYEEKLKSFFEEHLHADEEIRYCLAGSGYFDVRNPHDQWIRIELVPEDLIILPAGIYHRFTLDKDNYIKARRLFVGEPVWTPHSRPAENHPARKSYEQRFIKEHQCQKC